MKIGHSIQIQGKQVTPIKTKRSNQNQNIIKKTSSSKKDRTSSPVATVIARKIKQDNSIYYLIKLSDPESQPKWELRSKLLPTYGDAIIKYERQQKSFTSSQATLPKVILNCESPSTGSDNITSSSSSEKRKLCVSHRVPLTLSPQKNFQSDDLKQQTSFSDLKQRDKFFMRENDSSKLLNFDEENTIDKDALLAKTKTQTINIQSKNIDKLLEKFQSKALQLEESIQENSIGYKDLENISNKLFEKELEDNRELKIQQQLLQQQEQQKQQQQITQQSEQHEEQDEHNESIDQDDQDSVFGEQEPVKKILDTPKNQIRQLYQTTQDIIKFEKEQKEGKGSEPLNREKQGTSLKHVLQIEALIKEQKEIKLKVLEDQPEIVETPVLQQKTSSPTLQILKTPESKLNYQMLQDKDSFASFLQQTFNSSNKKKPAEDDIKYQPKSAPPKQYTNPIITSSKKGTPIILKHINNINSSGSKHSSNSGQEKHYKKIDLQSNSERQKSHEKTQKIHSQMLKIEKQKKLQALSQSADKKMQKTGDSQYTKRVFDQFNLQGKSLSEKLNISQNIFDQQIAQEIQIEKKQEIQLPLPSKGDFGYGDKAKKIVACRPKENEIMMDIEWESRNDGKIPDKTTISSKLVREYDPNLLIDFYESKIKFTYNNAEKKKAALAQNQSQGVKKEYSTPPKI